MARTNAWSDTQPADANAANTLGQSDRNIRVDVREAFQQLIGNTLSDALQDPIVPTEQTIEGLDARLAAIETVADEYEASKTIPILGGAFKSEDPTYQTSVTVPPNVVGGSTPAVLTLSYGLILPVGAVLDSIDFYVHSTGTANSSFTYGIYKRSIATVSTSNTVVATATKSSSWTAGTQPTLALSSLAETFVAGVGYGIYVVMTPNSLDRLYFEGVIVTYTTPPLG